MGSCPVTTVFRHVRSTQKEQINNHNVRDSSKKFQWNLEGKKYRLVNVCSFIETQIYSHRKTTMTLKWMERDRNMGHMWKKLMKNVDLDEPTPFRENIWDALNLHANRTKSLLSNFKKCLNHKFLLEQLKN